MNNIRANIIHLNKNIFIPNSVQYLEAVSRIDSLKKELLCQNITNYKIFDAIFNETAPYTGICKSHKSVVFEAKKNSESFCLVMEDDIHFTSPEAWDYFISNIPESFDIYLGSNYHPAVYEDGIVTGQFDSLILYVIHSRFYDEFLALPENQHLDRTLSQLSGTKEIRLCYPMPAVEHSGFSYNAKGERDYSHRLEGKALFGINT